MANRDSAPHTPGPLLIEDDPRTDAALVAMVNGGDDDETEELWKRLDIFNRSHSGRLTTDGG